MSIRKCHGNVKLVGWHTGRRTRPSYYVQRYGFLFLFQRQGTKQRAPWVILEVAPYHTARLLLYGEPFPQLADAKDYFAREIIPHLQRRIKQGEANATA